MRQQKSGGVSTWVSSVHNNFQGEPWADTYKNKIIIEMERFILTYGSSFLPVWLGGGFYKFFLSPNNDLSQNNKKLFNFYLVSQIMTYKGNQSCYADKYSLLRTRSYIVASMPTFFFLVQVCAAAQHAIKTEGECKDNFWRAYLSLCDSSETGSTTGKPYLRRCLKGLEAWLEHR